MLRPRLLPSSWIGAPPPSLPRANFPRRGLYEAHVQGTGGGCSRVAKRGYVPAAGFDRLTPLYDVLMRLTMREHAWRGPLVEQAGLEPGVRVLDVGVGSAALALEAFKHEPGGDIGGVDVDDRILARASWKVEEAGAGVQLVRGSAVDLPFEDGVFDRVLSSLVFHHLTRSEKVAAFREVRRVLGVGGELHFADWGSPSGVLTGLGFSLVRALDGFDRTRAHREGVLPGLLEEAGFGVVEEVGVADTVFGTMRRYRAVPG